MLYLIEILHQTTTRREEGLDHAKLYLIEILHQTTTKLWAKVMSPCCILSKFYIKPQLCGAPSFSVHSCILSKFYIKPQPSATRPRRRIVVSYRNSTSNHNIIPLTRKKVGVVSYRNSTSNHNGEMVPVPEGTVVSYRNSTSNHNCRNHKAAGRNVVSYRNSTSNHNRRGSRLTKSLLYLIEILHQTTTSGLILIDKVLLTGCLPL